MSCKTNYNDRFAHQCDKLIFFRIQSYIHSTFTRQKHTKIIWNCGGKQHHRRKTFCFTSWLNEAIVILIIINKVVKDVSPFYALNDPWMITDCLFEEKCLHLQHFLCRSFWLPLFSRPHMLSKLCQADGVDERSFFMAFLLGIVMRSSYLWHWDSYLLTPQLHNVSCVSDFTSFYNQKT